VAILPYYVANLNIEATYYAITGQYAEFPSLCFVDTLDNVGGLGIRSGHQHEMFGSLSEENVARIRRQNERRISVIIGNPPYNANQQNENDANPNRAYPHVDRQIKDTYIRRSTAQKTKLYDMYARFFRWASNRLADDGVLAFVTNRSFIDARTFDGFRKTVAEEFNEIHVVDLKGDARTSGERRRREGGNVFDDQIRVGVAIGFFVKRKGKSGCTIKYEAVHDYARGEDKRAWLAARKLAERTMTRIDPAKDGTWIGQVENDWSGMIPVADKQVKAGKKAGQDKAVFKLYSLGIITARDEWVYSTDRLSLRSKIQFFLQQYNEIQTNRDNSIKWSRALKRDRESNKLYSFDDIYIDYAQFRPFTKKFLYNSKNLIEMMNQQERIFGHGRKNIAIVFDVSGRPFTITSTEHVPDYHLVGDGMNLPLHRYTASGERVDNITDWALAQFIAAYGPDGRGTPPAGPMTRAGTAPAPGEADGDAALTREAIFAYVYAVLHDPVYRETYALNLKREFPRIPLHRDFWRWVGWGRRLLDLHVGYETVEPWPLVRIDTPDERARAAGVAPKPMLRSDPDAGLIVLDGETRLTGVPRAAFDYRLGNRSALDWVLDQHRERKPKDPTVRERFDTYRFADHKERVADLLARVTRVSVETTGIVAAMAAARR
jgi:predicted helicase